MKRQLLQTKEMLELLVWLDKELVEPTELTVHTSKAREDLRNLAYSAYVLAMANKVVADD